MAMAAPKEIDLTKQTLQSGSTEELCREAAQKLMEECHTTTGHNPTRRGTAISLEGGHHQDSECENSEKDTREMPAGQADTVPSQQPRDTVYEFPSSEDEQPPSYSDVAAETSIQIPLKRADGSVSFLVPPPPPPSPGDALHGVSGNIHHPKPMVIPIYPHSMISSPHPYGTPNPMYVTGHNAYAVVATSSPMVCAQTAQPTAPASQPENAPTTIVNQNSTTNLVNENKNNVNVVVENNINLGESHPSYICFSVTLCIICCLLDPTAMVCVLPALICSCVSCCTTDHNVARQTGNCALGWNITALVYGITAFFLLVAPVIVVGAIVAAIL